MKKLLIFLLAIGGLLMVCIYVFIPPKFEISKIEYINCNVNGAFRVISDVNTWEKWWPNANQKNNQAKISSGSFFYNGYSYRLSERFYNAIEVPMEYNYDTIESRINIIKINSDSVVMMWKCELPTGLNPITRIAKYWEAKAIINNMAAILSNLRLFLEKSENIYGIYLHVIISNDSTMVATRSVSAGYPSTSDIYNLIGSLKKYIAAQGAKENNFPMLNVKKLNDKEFETMVAIPVNKALLGNGKIFPSRFVPWKVLTAEVKGGNYTVNEALAQMQVYMGDYQKNAMAIPFASLVTDRSKEPDTLKWVTRIYTPVP